MAERKPFLARIDERLYEELRKWADAELRSVNGQIEFLLRRAVEERTGKTLDGKKVAPKGSSGGKA